MEPRRRNTKRNDVVVKASVILMKEEKVHLRLVQVKKCLHPDEERGTNELICCNRLRNRRVRTNDFNWYLCEIVGVFSNK